MKAKSISSIITLSKQASQKLEKVMREPLTTQQKKSLEHSIGVYSFYQKKWQKNK